MSWRITNRNNRNCYVNAEKTDNPDITYVGFMRDFQPHGLGAKYISNIISVPLKKAVLKINK